jgi:hypothetical protein
MLCGRPGWLVSECERIGGGRDSVDIDRARPSRVLESQDNQACVLNIDPRWLVLLHLPRLFAGAYFLVLCQRSQLPCAFATPAGWGDIVIGVLAVAVVSAMHTQFAKTFLLSCNTLGLIDIIFVVSSALRFGLKDWQSMHALRELPLSLLPTFLVPLIMVSHVLIFVRLTRSRIGSH